MRISTAKAFYEDRPDAHHRSRTRLCETQRSGNGTEMRHSRRDRQELRPRHRPPEDLGGTPKKKKRETYRTYRRLHRYQERSIGRGRDKGHRQRKESRHLQRSRSTEAGSRNSLTDTRQKLGSISSRQPSAFRLRFFKRRRIPLLKWR